MFFFLVVRIWLWCFHGIGCCHDLLRKNKSQTIVVNCVLETQAIAQTAIKCIEMVSIAIKKGMQRFLLTYIPACRFILGAEH